MILGWLILILSAAMVGFYFQATCQRLLLRKFDREYCQSIAAVIRLEFPALRETLEGFGPQVDYSRLPRTLKSDFLALTYLLKNTTAASRSFSKEEWLLIIYFRWQLLSLAVRRLLKADEKKAVIRSTSVLQYFANVVGEHVHTVGFGNSTPASYLANV
ncbi:MAG: hypothetical protein ABSF46_14325 [Terriglobia bacterium]